MKRERAWVAGAVVVASGVAVAAVGCVNGDNGQPPAGPDAAVPTIDAAQPGIDVNSPDTYIPPPPPDAGTDTYVPEQPDVVTPVDSADAAVPTANVRFAFLASAGVVGGMPRRSPKAGAPAQAGLDVCVALHGTNAWQGPLLAGAGLNTGLLSLEVSSYLAIPAAQYDVLVVPAGQPCATPDAGADGGAEAGADGGAVMEYTNLPPLVAGQAFTVAVVDPVGGGTTPTAVAFVDETTTTAGNAKMRLVNAAYASSTPVTYGLGGGVAFQPVFSNVSPGLDPGADSQGYREVPEALGVDTSLVATPLPLGSIASSAYPVAAGSITTAFAVQAGVQMALLVCSDGKNAATAGLTDCTVSSSPSQAEQAYTRFGNFIAGSTPPSVDVCIKYHALTAFAGPLLGSGADAGPDAGPPLALVPLTSGSLTASNVSGYFNVHGGYNYDVRLVAAGSADCSTPADPASIGAYAAPIGDTTLAAVGWLTPPADAGAPIGPVDAGLEAGADAGPASTPLSTVAFTLQPFTGDEASSSAVAMRFVHVATLVPQPFNIADGVTFSFNDVPYGGVATFPSPVDGAGYFTLTGTAAVFNVTETISGNNVASDFDNFTKGTANTLFVYSYVFNGTQNFVNTESCDDSRVIGGLASCSILNGG